MWEIRILASYIFPRYLFWYHRIFKLKVSIMPSGKKRKRSKIAKHKRKKRLRKNRHKKK